MIELLLQAERALAMGLLDQAARMYRQAADADPRNSIAVVGLARVALERGDEPAAWRLARRALGIDPENVAAQRLAGRLEEVWAYSGRSLPEAAATGAPGADDVGSAAPAAAAPGPAAAAPASPSVAREPPTAPAVARAAPAQTGSPAGEPDSPAAASGRRMVDRLLRRNRP